MVYTAGVWLLYAGVVLRLLVRYAALPRLGLVMLLLVLYGLLLLLSFLVEPFRRYQVSSLQFRLPSLPPEHARNRDWISAAYLALQTGLVVALFTIPPHVDFSAALFVPLSVQAVLFFGRRVGFACIALFPLLMFVPLTRGHQGWPAALAMSALAGGLGFLFGSYAHQVHRAERARSENQRLLDDLQAANRQLRGYAAQVEELASERERGRLARELHDSVTQTVFSMNLTVQSARLLLAQDRGRAVGQLLRLEELAAGAMGEIQTLVSQLRPAPAVHPAAAGLPAALRQMAVERQLRDGLRVTVEVQGERSLSQHVASALYHVAQEALTNVARHAGTCEVSIRLTLEGGFACLEIEDCGLGFDPLVAAGQRGHLGLAGMAERAREIGWNLSIDSRPGSGTRIRVEEIPSGGRG